MRVVGLPLAGICVLEIGQGVAGPFCSKLSAEFWARVITVEPPSGYISRQHALLAHDQPGPEASPQFLYLNTAKHSIALPWRPCWHGRPESTRPV